MSLKLKDLNLTNIKAFIQGTTAYLLDTYGPNWAHASETVKEQVSYRSMKCPKCLEAGHCLKCGCATPGVFYSEKGCPIGKYPLLLSPEYWEEFKKNEEAEEFDLNRKFFSVWKCDNDQCGKVNAYPYTTCFHCGTTHTNERIEELIHEYQNYNRSPEVRMESSE